MSKHRAHPVQYLVIAGAAVLFILALVIKPRNSEPVPVEDSMSVVVEDGYGPPEPVSEAPKAHLLSGGPQIGGFEGDGELSANEEVDIFADLPSLPKTDADGTDNDDDGLIDAEDDDEQQDETSKPESREITDDDIARLAKEARTSAEQFAKRVANLSIPQFVERCHFRWTLPDWCFRLFGPELDTEGLIALAKGLGHSFLDLVAYDQMDTVIENGVGVSCVLPDMGKDDKGEGIAPFVPGFNQPDEHGRVYNALDLALQKADEHNVEFVLVFTGMNTGEDRDVQYQRIVDAYTAQSSKDGKGESLVQKAERLGITFIIEMLNTEGDEATWRGHPGYLGNSTDEVVTKVIQPIGSKNFKLAFDVYHVVMMGEDPIAMIDKHHEHIGYVHVAGVQRQEEGHHPQNRGELFEDGQVIDYEAVFKKLREKLPKSTFVCMEWIPNLTNATRVQLNAKSAIMRCEVAGAK